MNAELIERVDKQIYPGILGAGFTCKKTLEVAIPIIVGAIKEDMERNWELYSQDWDGSWKRWEK